MSTRSTLTPLSAVLFAPRCDAPGLLVGCQWWERCGAVGVRLLGCCVCVTVTLVILNSRPVCALSLYYEEFHFVG